MCGIIGYIGDNQAAPILIEGLERLEYRGYDSAGIAVRDDVGHIQVIKSCGRLSTLSKKIDGGKSVFGSCGIGHTRWATHGEPSLVNSHPHVSCDGEVILVHNGIIENYAEYKKILEKKGYDFISATDTEVATNLIAHYYKKYGRNPKRAITETMKTIDGSFAFGIMFKDDTDTVYAVRKNSPIIIGRADDGYYLASDVPAILSHTNKIYYLDNMEFAAIKRDGICFYNTHISPITKECVEITWDAQAAEKGGYDHFLIKEIEEQPKAVSDTINHYIKDGEIGLSEIGITDEQIRGLERIYIIACGSAYNAAEVARYEIERVANIPVETEVASEFRYRHRVLAKNSMAIIISQSGETADSLAALKLAKKNGIPTYAIVNVIGSSIAREADGVMYTFAGPEISVATTKAYSAQLAAIYLIGIKFAYVRGIITRDSYEDYIRDLCLLPEKINECFECRGKIKEFAQRLIQPKNVFFIGRGLDCAVALEGSLKLKEVTYIQSEAYAAGELKHGTISLVEKGTLVIGLMTQDDLFGKTASNVEEVRSRGAYVFGLANQGNTIAEAVSDFILYIPKTNNLFKSSLSVIPLQYLAYYLGVARGLDVDKPRNLAKSVTVE